MKTSTFSTSCLSCLLYTSVSAAAPKVVSMKFSRHQELYRQSRLVPRDTVTSDAENGLDAKYYNFLPFYYVNVTIGNPPQDLAMLIDTGSGTTWTASANSGNACSLNGPQTCPLGTFNEMQSTSYNEQSNDPFSYFYGGDIAVEGVYFEDTFSTSGTTINNLLMGLGTQTTLPVGATFNGILGLGPDYSQGKVLFNCTPSAEKTCDEGDTSCYQKAFNPCVDDSVIDALYKQKSISTKTFSLWLNDVDSSHGIVLFGGYDKSKYSPPLTTLPMQASAGSGNYQAYFVVLDGMTGGPEGQDYDIKFPVTESISVMLDSGCPNMLLPESIVTPILDYVGAFYMDGINFPLIPCSQSTAAYTIRFGLGGPHGPVIAVAMSELVIIRYDNDGRQLQFPNGQFACEFGMATSNQGNTYLLGDTFLRSAYVIYNLDKNQIHIAQALWSSSTTASTLDPRQNSIVEISNAGSIPDAVSISGAAVSAAPTYTNLPVYQAAAISATGQLALSSAPGASITGTSTATAMATQGAAANSTLADSAGTSAASSAGTSAGTSTGSTGASGTKTSGASRGAGGFWLSWIALMVDFMR